MGKRAEFFYEFGSFRIDPAERLLLREGRIIPLTPKAYETLLALVENSGHVMEKDDLIERIWPDSFVEEGSLARNVSHLRKLLSTRGEGQEFIATLPKRGYRFVAEVRQVQSDDAELLARRRTRTRIIAREEIEEEDSPAEATPHQAQPPANGFAVKSLAVLPFRALGTDDADDYLGFGLTDALITQLGNTGHLVVRPTSAVRKFVEQRPDAVAAGRELNVDAVLEGAVQRAGTRLRLTVQMVCVLDHVEMWAGKFDAEMADIFAMQDTIAEQVASSLALKLSSAAHKRLIKRYTENVEAYKEYLKGRYFWNKRTEENFRKAIEYFERTIELDPTYGLAYAGLADCYNVLPHWGAMTTKAACQSAKGAARRALEIDDELAEAHASLGYTQLFYDWDWHGAEISLQRALQLNPNYALAHQWSAGYLAATGRFDDAFAEMELAQQLDPLSLSISENMGVLFYLARRYEEAVAQMLSTLEVAPQQAIVHYDLGYCYEQLGRLDESIKHFEKAVELSGNNTRILSGLGHAYAVSGRRNKAAHILDELQRPSIKGNVSPYSIALIHIGLGEKDAALTLLEKACEERDGGLAFLKVDPEMDSLRTDPRFQAVLGRVGLAP